MSWNSGMHSSLRCTYLYSCIIQGRWNLKATQSVGVLLGSWTLSMWAPSLVLRRQILTRKESLAHCPSKTLYNNIRDNKLPHKISTHEYRHPFWLQQPHRVYKHPYKKRHPFHANRSEFADLAVFKCGSYFSPVSICSDCKQAIDTGYMLKFRQGLLVKHIKN